MTTCWLRCSRLDTNAKDPSSPSLISIYQIEYELHKLIVWPTKRNQMLFQTLSDYSVRVKAEQACWVCEQRSLVTPILRRKKEKLRMLDGETIRRVFPFSRNDNIVDGFERLARDSGPKGCDHATSSLLQR